MKVASEEEVPVHLVDSSVLVNLLPGTTTSVIDDHDLKDVAAATTKTCATDTKTATTIATALLEESSIDSSSVWIECDDSVVSGYSKSSASANNKRRVSFSKLEIREYNITIGDHPLCRDGLPLQLDWEHSDVVVTEINVPTKNDDNSIDDDDDNSCSTNSTGLLLAQRQDKYQMPRRLSYEEKRERLMNIANYSDQRDRNQKLGQVIQGMQSWWKEHPILPMPDLSSIREEEEYEHSSFLVSHNEEEEEENDNYYSDSPDFVEIEPPSLEEYVFYWRRNPIHGQKRSPSRSRPSP